MADDTEHDALEKELQEFFADIAGRAQAALDAVLRACPTLSREEALRQMHLNLPKAMRLALDLGAEDPNETKFTYLVLDAVFRRMRRSLGN